MISWTHRSSANEVHVYAPTYSPTIWRMAFIKTEPGQHLSVALAESEWSNGEAFVIEERWVAEDGEYLEVRQHVYHPQNTHLLLIRGNIAPAVVALNSRFGHRPRQPRVLPSLRLCSPTLLSERTETTQFLKDCAAQLNMSIGKTLAALYRQLA